MRPQKWAWIVAGVCLFGIGAIAYRKNFAWKRFDVVQEGVIYRSGILKDWQLREAITRYKIRTVFSFTLTNYEQERAICRELGVDHHLCYLDGSGAGPDDPYLRFLEVVRDLERRPILVHCSAGVQRTGGAIALYRVLYQGWSIDQATREMMQKGNDGNRRQMSQIEALATRLATLPTEKSARR